MPNGALERTYVDVRVSIGKNVGGDERPWVPLIGCRMN